jgi:hypothetical protein
MNKFIFPILLAVLGSLGLQAQSNKEKKKAAKEETKKEKPPKTDWSKVSLGDRANDHFMVQIGYDGWATLPDSIRTTGFGRHLNVYVMLDKPFKTNPQWSVGLGVGIGSSNIYFDKMYVDLKGSISTTQVSFVDVKNANHFDKYKLTAVWAEAPIELRHVSNPLKSDKSFKYAFGVKIGTMISGYTRGKDLQSKDGQSLYGNKYVQKEKDRKYLNNVRLAPTFRIGYGNFTIYGAYQITNLWREGQGPGVRPFSVGLCLSGL